MLKGLTEVPTSGLKALLGHVYRGEVACPLTITELTRTGLQYCAIDLLGHLRTLDRSGVVAVLTAVLAEREEVTRAAERGAFTRRVNAEIAEREAAATGARPILIASRNTHKVEELSRMAPHVRWMALPVEAGDPPETGDTFDANALQKARFVAAWASDHLPMPVDCIADDSGLEVDALGGRPGVWSKRYSPEGTDTANNALLLRELADTPDNLRTARYRCVIALLGPEGRAGDTGRVFDGRCEGRIARVGRGQGGFGYDPLFLPDAAGGRTMAELSPVEKDAMSHRGEALRRLLAALDVL